MQILSTAAFRLNHVSCVVKHKDNHPVFEAAHSSWPSSAAPVSEESVCLDYLTQRFPLEGFLSAGFSVSNMCVPGKHF